MKALRLSELRDLLQSVAFASWWAEVVRTEAELREAGARHDDLLAQSRTMELRSELAGKGAEEAFARAGVIEADSARVGAEVQRFENQALELVSRYEEQRFRASDAWYRLGGAERTVEEHREALASGRPPAGSGGRRADPEALAKLAEKQHRALDEEYRRESEKKARLWDEVEQAWSHSFELGLRAAERAAGARRVRGEAERLHREVEARSMRARQLAADAATGLRERDAAAARLDELLGAAPDRFGCVAGRRFLYWRQPEDSRAAWAVPLFHDAEGYNLEVRALAIYSVSRQRGVAFLEPAREGALSSEEEGDHRFEGWFLGPRRGRRAEATSGVR